MKHKKLKIFAIASIITLSAVITGCNKKEEASDFTYYIISEEVIKRNSTNEEPKNTEELKPKTLVKKQNGYLY